MPDLQLRPTNLKMIKIMEDMIGSLKSKTLHFLQGMRKSSLQIFQNIALNEIFLTIKIDIHAFFTVHLLA